MIRPTPLRALIRHPSGLPSSVGFNGLAQISPIVVAFAITPLLLHRLGLDRFGIWSLALIFLSTLTALDGGISASLARFFALYSARSEREESARLLLGSLLFFVVLGFGLLLVAFPIAPVVVDLLHIPARLRDEAVFVLRCLPSLAALALMADTTSALLEGSGKFRALAVSMLASSGTLAVAVVLLVKPGSHLGVLVLATALRYLVLMVVSMAFAVRDLSFHRPLLPSRETTRQVVRYSSRMQLSAAAAFINAQMDGLVIAAVEPVRYVGLYNVALQAASAVRSLPLYAFAPLLTRLTQTFRNEGREAAATDFGRFERRWLPAVLGYGIVGVAAIGFAVPIWLGQRYVLSGIAAAILLGGYVVHVGLTGMRTCYVRAVGRPGLETRYLLVWMAANAALTVPAVLAAGVLGVVAATAVTVVAASAYFVRLCRREEHLTTILPGGRWLVVVAVAAAATVAGEIAVASTGRHGFLPLALAALPAFVGWAIVIAGLRRTTVWELPRPERPPASRTEGVGL